MWNNYVNVYLCHTYKWQRILNHCDIDGISYFRILLLINTRTCTNTTTFSVENRLLGNKNLAAGGFALSDADTLPQSNQAFFSWIFALFSDTSFQSARLNFSHWNNTEKNGMFTEFVWNQCQGNCDICIHYDVSLSQRIVYMLHTWLSIWDNYRYTPIYTKLGTLMSSAQPYSTCTKMRVFSLIYTPSIKVSVMSDEHLKPILVGALYINGKGTLWHLFKRWLITNYANHCAS